MEHKNQVSMVLQAEQCPDLPVSELQPRIAQINERAAADDLPTLHAALTAPAADDVWMDRTARTLAKGSPTSAALILRQWQRGRDMSLVDVFREELTLSTQCARHPDFIEGVRALLVDKDNAPAWQPATVAEVTEDWIAGHYVEPWQGEHPSAIWCNAITLPFLNPMHREGQAYAAMGPVGQSELTIMDGGIFHDRQ
jgi:hypothetical protein